MSVATTEGVYEVLRARVLGWAGVSTLLGSGATARFLADDPGDLSAAFSGTKALLRVEEYDTPGFGEGYRSEIQPEFTLFARGNGAAAAVRQLGDLIEDALRGFTYTAGGIVFGVRRMSRVPLPAGSGDVDRNVKQLTLRFRAIRWTD